MLNKRVLTAVVGIPLVLGLIALDAIPMLLGLPLLVLVGGIVALASEEYSRLLKQGGVEPYPSLAMMVALLPLAFVYITRFGPPHPPPVPLPNWLLLILTLAVVFDVLMIALALISDIGKWSVKAIRDFLFTAGGGLFIGVTLSFVLMLSMRRFDMGHWAVVLAFIATWVLDALAYLIGRKIGAHKVWPRISPGKSWEGSLAGLAGAVLAAGLVFWGAAAWAHLNGGRPTPSLDLLTRIGPGGAIALGAAIGVVGQFGDLLESWLKRRVGAKDSGDLLPGHGGILDRFDSLMLAAPTLFFILLWLR
jgi:phosphatidate cytidylyltransferase